MEAGSESKTVSPTSDSSRWVPIRRAAEILGVSIDTVRRWDKKGLIHSSRLRGRNRYFDVAELDQVNTDKPLSISEAAEQIGVSTSTLRRLESRGLINPKRNENGERLYTKQTLADYQEAKQAAKNKKKRVANKAVTAPFTRQKLKEPPILTAVEPLVIEPSQSNRSLRDLFSLPKLRLAASAAAIIAFLVLVSLVRLNLPDAPISKVTLNEQPKLALQRSKQPAPGVDGTQDTGKVIPPGGTKTTQKTSPDDSSTILQPLIAGITSAGGTTLDSLYDAEPGRERTITADDKGLSIDIYKPAKYFYVEDGTKFVVRDNEIDVLTVDNDKNIVTHGGSKLDIQGSLTLDGQAGKKDQILTSGGQGQTPTWNNSGDVTVGGVSCTNCVDADQIKDIYVLNTGDEIGGNLTITGQSDLRFSGPSSTNYVGFQAPSSVSSSLTWTLPGADGTADQVLTTDGSGTLSWAASGSGSFTDFILSDGTNTQTIADGNTLTVSAGSDIDTTVSSTDTVTIALESTIDTVSTINLSGTGTLNGLDVVDSTGENTIEALIFDSDAQNISGVWEVQDDTNFAIGLPLLTPPPPKPQILSSKS